MSQTETPVGEQPEEPQPSERQRNESRPGERQPREPEPGKPQRKGWRRFVALGDSFTEGIGDPDPDSVGGFRGWADRVAEQLSLMHPDFGYANLSIRGRLLRQILDEQLAPALALQPDLVTVSAGGNDLLRPRADPDALAELLDAAVGELTDTGATVVLFNGPDIATTPVVNLIRGKVGIYNANLHAVALRHQAVYADMWAMRPILDDARMWSPDRLHFSAQGHQRIAMMVLDALGVGHDLVADEVPAVPPVSWRQARGTDLRWAKEYLVPWVGRRIRHQSSGDGITAKRPTFQPIAPARLPQTHPVAATGTPGHRGDGSLR